MRYLVVGLGNIGQRRRALLGERCVATADPFNEAADYQDARACPLESFDAAILAIPDDHKLALAEHFLSNGKHVLVEKPLPLSDETTAHRLEGLASAKRLALYAAYNHRFEPALVRLRERLLSGAIGEVYHGRLLYGNGTVQNIVGTWRDTGLGVLSDLGCHLLDLLAYLGLTPHPLPPSPPPPVPGDPSPPAPLSLPRERGNPEVALGSSGTVVFLRDCVDLPSPLEGEGVGVRAVTRAPRLVAAQRLETERSPDHAAVVSTDGRFTLEVSFHHWRNSFAVELYGAKGSLHCLGLRKWGGSELIERRRVFPSGVPEETRWTDAGPDETWAAEIAHFERRCQEGVTDLSTDLWIARAMQSLASQLEGAMS